MSLLLALSGVVALTWVIAGCALSVMKISGVDRDAPARRCCRAIWAELKPFYLTATAVIIARHVMTGEMVGWNALWDACRIYNWFQFKDIDDDDRWKRRKAKLVEKVAQRGGRLVVVPAGGRGR